MKVFAVVGSPRKRGNTDLLVDELLRGAQEAGAAVEKVYLADMDIGPCDACDACHVLSGECVHYDDMTSLYEKLFASDVWVLGTPVYWWGPSAQIKLFIDRWYMFASEVPRQCVKGKRAVLVTPFEETNPATPRHLVGMLTDTLNYLEIEFAGQILVTANKRGEVAENAPAMQKARELGHRLAQDGISPGTFS